MVPRPAQPSLERPRRLWPLAPWWRWAWQGLWLPGHSVNQFLRFALVGASGVLVNYLVMWACFKGLGMHYVAASVAAFLVANVNNFVWNKLFTFRDAVRGFWPVLKQQLHFLWVCSLGLLINEAVLVALVTLAGMNPLWANLLGVLVATLGNFLGSRYIAFRPRPAE